MRLSTYGKIAAELYALEDPQNRQRILDFYLQHATGAPSPYLELMSGAGYFLILFLERGAEIDGLDASADMLNVCRAECARRNLSPTLYHQTAPDLDLPRRYGYIFIPDRSFGLLCEEETVRATLAHLRDALLPGGRFIFDVAPPPDHWENTAGWQETPLRQLPDGSTVRTRLLVTHEEGGTLLRVLAKYERLLDGILIETEVDDYAERLYTQDQMRTLLIESGVTRVQLQKAYEGGEPGERDRVAYICER